MKERGNALYALRDYTAALNHYRAAMDPLRDYGAAHAATDMDAACAAADLLVGGVELLVILTDASVILSCGERAQLVNHALIKQYLVQDGPEADRLLAQELQEPVPLLLRAGAVGVAVLEEIVTLLVQVVTEAGNAAVPEKFNAVLQFQNLRIAALAEAEVVVVG